MREKKNGELDDTRKMLRANIQSNPSRWKEWQIHDNQISPKPKPNPNSNLLEPNTVLLDIAQWLESERKEQREADPRASP